MVASPRTVLFDTNVWHDLALEQTAREFRHRLRESGLRGAIAPTVMDELVMTQKLSLRDGMVRVAARSWWLRLLPIGVLEVQQLVDALKVHRREWLRNPPDLRTFHHELGAYTGNGAGTYWHAVRNRTDGYIEMSETNTEIRAYQHRTTKAARQTSLPFDSIDLGSAMSARFPGPINIESWRFQASRMIPTWVAALPQLRTWFDCFVDQTRVGNDDWLHFWAESVSPAEASRAWLRCAMFHLQAARRPNNGVAGDLAIASYLVDVDFFATKDRPFKEIIERIRPVAPFRIADVLYGADSAELLSKLED